MSLLEMTDEIAWRVVAEAGEAGGIDEVRRIAAWGWVGDVGGAPASPELMVAIRARARAILAEIDVTQTGDAKAIDRKKSVQSLPWFACDGCGQLSIGVDQSVCDSCRRPRVSP
jgi:hypothetical protein